MVTAAKDFNRSIILNLVRNEAGISRTIVAQRTGLSKATISGIVDDLIHEGLLVETGKASASSGRRPVMLGVNPQARLAMGIEVGSEGCHGVLTNLAIEPVRSASRPLPDTRVETVTGVIADLACDLLSGYDRSSLIGAGVGIPGIYDDEADWVTLAEHLGWRKVPLRRRLEDQLLAPVVVVNRTNAAALGEKSYGAGTGVNDLFYVRLGSGIGGGAILGGKLYIGVSGSAGEIGHTIVEPNGQLCACGSRGCLETVATTGAIVARARQKLLRGRDSRLLEQAGGHIERVTWSLVADLAREHDPVAAEVVREAGDYLGIAVANVVTLFNPALVIVGGPMTQAGTMLLEVIRERIMEAAFAPSVKTVEIAGSALGAAAVSIGAASMFVDEFFEAPLRAWLRHTRPAAV